jgi:PAS domain S-box-containing protein
MYNDNKRLTSAIRWGVKVLAAYALIGGATTLFGWFAGIRRLTDWTDCGISMFPNAAFAAVCSAAALLFTNGDQRWSTLLRRFLGCIVLLLGAATLFEHVSGINLGIDTALIRPTWGQKAAMALGRMGPPASISYTLLGLALLLISTKRHQARRFAPALAISVSAIATLSLMGYLLGADPLFAVARYTGIAMQTATMLCALGLATLASAPECDPMRTLQSQNAAGLLTRCSLPFIILLPVLLGWLRVRGQLAGWFDTAMGTSLLTLCLVAMFCGLLWWWVRAVAKHETARKDAEQAVHKQATVLQAIHDNATELIFTKDVEGRLTYANAATLKAIGMSREQAFGSLDLKNFREPSQHKAISHHDRIVAQTGETIAVEEPYTCADGIQRIFLSTKSPVRDETGNIVGVIGVSRDITERKRSEQRQNHLAAIVDHSEDAIISKNLDSIITSWNPGAQSLFGYTAAEMIGKSVREMIPPEYAGEEDIVLIRLRAGESVHRETVRLTKDGRRVPVSITSSPIKNASGEVIGGSKIVRDITVQKQTEEKLREAQRKLLLHAADLEATVAERTAKLQETVEELQNFSYSIAHDMRAPLRAMGTFAQLLLNEMPAGASPEMRTYGERIVIGAARLDNLINDALNYTKATLQEFPVQPVDLSKLVRGLLDTYPNLHADSADIRTEGELPTVLGNESLLTQCFSNLLGNAVKFVAAGVRPKVCIRSQQRDGFAKIWVEDNGIGIPIHAQPRLFAMFQKLDNQYEGTGIGLAIVRKVVERMGGKVGVESEPDRGSRFWVELRVAAKKETL